MKLLNENLILNPTELKYAQAYAVRNAKGSLRFIMLETRRERLFFNPYTKRYVTRDFTGEFYVQDGRKFEALWDDEDHQTLIWK